MDNRLKLCQIFAAAQGATYYNRFDIRRGRFAESGEFRVKIRGVRCADTILYNAPPGKWAVDAIAPFGCRGEHCSPVRFSPLGGITGSVARAVNDRPYGLTRYVVATAKRQGGVKTPPYE